MKLSIVSPCYGAPTLLRQLVAQITETVSQLTDSYEIILVEDCSPDNSREIIRDICAADKHVKGIFLSRNFGQQSALNAGYDTATGDYVVTLDCDLQNPPTQIRALYQKAQEGYDIVFATRRHRPDTFMMTKGSHVFNKLMGFLTDTKQDSIITELFLCLRSNDRVRIDVDHGNRRQVAAFVKHLRHSYFLCNQTFHLNTPISRHPRSKGPYCFISAEKLSFTA